MTIVAAESPRFRRLCQVAATTGPGSIERVLDQLVLVPMAFQEGPWRDAADWVVALEELFGVRVSRSDIIGALTRCVDAGLLNHNRYANTYEVRQPAKAELDRRIELAAAGEQSARESWLGEIDPLLSEVGSDALWRCLLGYAGRIFRRFGSDAISLLQNGLSEGDLDSQAMLDALHEALDDSDLSSDLGPLIGAEVARFFDGTSAVRSAYATELMSSTFNFMALGVDEATRRLLREGLPEITIFVDTNVLYSLIGAHSSALDAATADLFDILISLKVKLYCHTKTLTELENTLEGVGHRLRARQWTSAMSRAMLSAVPHAISSIETRFHQINAETPTTPEIFLQRYRSPLPILEQYGVGVYREATSTPASMEQRALLTVEYMEWLKENGPRRRRNSVRYEAADHDITLWLATRARQMPAGRGPIFCGAMLLSADSALRRFDRMILTPEHGGTAPVVVSPSSLLQALSPFATVTSDVSDATFAQLFATPEFRGVGSNYQRTVQDISAHLATFADLPEETAIKLLTDSMLITRLRSHSPDSVEFSDLIDEAIVAENEALIEERNAAHDAQSATKARLEEAAAQLQLKVSQAEASAAQSSQPEDLRILLAELKDQIEQLRQVPIVTTTVNATYAQVGRDFAMPAQGGDQFLNIDSSVGAQGQNASASQFTQGDSSPFVLENLRDLGRELGELRVDAAARATSSADFEIVTEIAKAEEAAAKGDLESTTSHLRKVGNRGLEIAQALGVGLAVAAIKHAIGM
jgi:hypothetical protein